MRAVALRPFRYSEDGITVRVINRGEAFDCARGLFPGLEREGYVRAELSDAADRAPIEVGASVALATPVPPAEAAQDGDDGATGGERNAEAPAASGGAPTGSAPDPLPDDRDALAAIARGMGLSVHHNAGAPRIRAAIEAARAAKE